VETFLAGKSADFGKRIKTDYERWGEVICAGKATDRWTRVSPSPSFGPYSLGDRRDVPRWDTSKKFGNDLKN